jgi:hypothetical protein
LGKDRRGWMQEHANGAKRHVCDAIGESDGRGRLDVRLVTPTGAGSGFRPTCLMERVSKALEGSTGGLTTYALRQTVQGKDKGIIAAVAALEAEAYIASEAGARGPVYRSVRPFRDLFPEGRPE